MKREIRNRLPLALLLVLALLPSAASADPGNSFCIQPPFITAGVKPNLLLMIDNSASMYDPAYTDQTVIKYCANNTSQSCTTVGSTCAGTAICKVSAQTTTTTVSSPVACTTNAECSVHVAGDTCNTGKGQCKKAVSTVTTTTTTPLSCSSDADCQPPAPFGTANDTCNNKCTQTTRQCLDSTYSNTGTYTGYFRQTATVGGVASDVLYCYSTKSNQTICDGSGTYDRFVGNATMPATCTYGGSSSTTPYVCVDEDATTHKVTRFVASGRFLNWLSMSKFDIEKSILTGGKFLGTDLVGESRGCSGRKFIKTLPALPSISFGLRGGDSTVNNTSQATQYGTTYIEIYKGNYDEGACTAALNDWMDVQNTNMGPLQVDTKNCIGGTGSISDELAAANQTIHDCFWYFNGHGLTNLQPIKNTCAQIYQSKSPSEILSASAPDAICSNALSHDASINDSGVGNTTGYLGLCFTGGTWNNDCALIENQDFCQAMGGTGAVADPSSDSGTSQTIQNVPGFVMELGLGNLPMINDYTTDLSPVPANATKGFPLHVYDPDGYEFWPPTGLIQKYEDNIRFGAMTFQNNGSGSECATGGVCSSTSTNAGTVCTTDATCTGGGKCLFTIPCAKTCSNLPTRQCNNPNDCTVKNPLTGTITTGTCDALAKTDGGKVISYVGAGTCSASTTVPCYVDAECSGLSPAGQYCNPSIGDHSPGKCSTTTGTSCITNADCPSGEYCRLSLLRSIDEISATSWTPFAEAYYNAIGYLARYNDYTVAVPTSRSDSNFSNLPAPNTAASYVTDRNPSQFRCQSNNMLLITDGMSTADKSSTVDTVAALYAPQAPYTIGGVKYKPGDVGYVSSKGYGYDSVNKCPSYAGSRSVNTLAWLAKNRNIKTLTTSSPASTTAPVTASESITTYVVYSGPATSGQPGLCDPKTLMNSTADNGGTTLLEASSPDTLYAKIEAALSAVAAKAASGTAASILSNSEGSGANILQAVFYPKKVFDNSTYVTWIGEMQNLWYFVDPYIQNSTIREDTIDDLKLNLTNDYVVRFAFNNSLDKTMVQRYSDANGDSVVTDSDKVGGLIDPDYVSSIWRAGLKLWSRSDASDARTIYTGYGSTSGSTPRLFTKAVLNPASPYATTLWDDLQIPAGDDGHRYDIADKLIDYIRGTDQSADSTPCLNTECIYRKRRVTMGFCTNASTKRCTTETQSTDCPTGGTCSLSTNEWKLGDIISSTPRVQSTVRLNTYNLPPSGGYNDKSYQAFINSSDYKDNGMVYVGANDGMFHAFSLGVLDVTAKGFQKAELTIPTGTVIGKEKWAFIPKHSIPYLKYYSDKNYDHIYYIDGRTNLIDASIGSTCASDYWECAKPRNGSVAIVDSDNKLTSANPWRTVVIAGMGLGGASVDPAVTACTEGATGNCVKTPRPGLGYSSYFAFDVTDPNNPIFLWEFSNPDLGYATTGPAIVRVGDKDKNGRWFAVFGNGPLGPIDTGSNQFKGESIQHLRFFVVDLQTGVRVATLNDTDTLGLTNAFVGTLLGGSIDADRRDITMAGNYQDDAIYAGYVQKTSGTGWTDGGVVRIMTKEDIDPTHWVVSKVISGIGPVTTAIARTQDTKNRNLWLYFGTGRFYFRDSVGLDDNGSRRSLFGIQEPCYNTATRSGNVLDPNCTTTLSDTSLQDQTTTIHTLTAADKGWRIDLDIANSTTNEGAERVVTDTVALTNGTVYFTSFKPTMDICGYGGNSFLWGVKYDTGGQAAANALVGKALIQLSTGEFREVDLSTAFTDKGGRRMESPMTGKPPSDAPPIVSSVANRPVKKILHIQEH